MPRHAGERGLMITVRAPTVLRALRLAFFQRHRIRSVLTFSREHQGPDAVAWHTGVRNAGPPWPRLPTAPGAFTASVRLKAASMAARSAVEGLEHTQPETIGGHPSPGRPAGRCGLGRRGSAPRLWYGFFRAAGAGRRRNTTKRPSAVSGSGPGSGLRPRAGARRGAPRRGLGAPAGEDAAPRRGRRRLPRKLVTSTGLAILGRP